MYKFIKNHVNQIMGVLLSVFSLVYIYLFQLVMEVVFHRDLNFFSFLAGGMLIIAGLLFFVTYCTPLIVILCKENICKEKKIGTILDHTDKGVKIEIENHIFVLPCKLKEKDYPKNSELVVYTDKKLDTLYLPVLNQPMHCIVGMIVSMLFIICSIFGFGAFIYFII